MLTLKDAIKIVEKRIPKNQTLRDSYGEAQGKYLFVAENAQGMIPPGGGFITVDKTTGVCCFEFMEREENKPWSPIRGYKKLELTD